MKRVLKNDIRQHVHTFFRGKTLVFKSKASKVFNMEDEEESKEYFNWLEKYGFIRDITANVKGVNENEND